MKIQSIYSNSEQVPLHARVQPRAMYLPAGIHTITPAMGGGSSARVTLNVDELTAGVLNAHLELLNAKRAPVRACFDKNHEGKEATAWLKWFEWSSSPSPGIYAVLEWSGLGEEYVTGKVLRAVSASFFTDADLPRAGATRGQTYVIAAGKRGSPENPARVIGIDFPFAGTLTNDPAFTNILPLWASARTASQRWIHLSDGRLIPV